MNRRHSLALVVLLVACGESATAPVNTCASFAGEALVTTVAPTRLVLVGASPGYQSGRVRSLSLSDLTLTPLAIEATGDTVARPLGRWVALLHRAAGDQDNLTLFDPSDASRVCQIGLVTDGELRAAGGRRPYVNAHDVLAVDAATLYVARREMPSLAVVDVARGAVVRTIDLTPWQGVGRAPHAAALARVGDEVWLTLQRHDDPLQMRSTQPGVVLRIDPARERVLGAITLRYANPVSAIVASPDGRQRWVVTAGSYNVVGDGAVEAIDVATGRLLDPVVTERDVDGNLDALTVIDARRIALRVTAERQGTTAVSNVSVVVFDRETRATTTLAAMAQWGAAAAVRVGERLFVADPGRGAYWEGAGLRVYPVNALTGAGRWVPMDPGLLPYDAQPAR